VLLPALVLYVAADGVYLDEGRAEGVRAGDQVSLGALTLQIEALNEHGSRTGPPPPGSALRIGAEVQIQKSATPEEEAAPVKRPPQPPKIDEGRAAQLWAGAEDGWAQPQATKERPKASVEEKELRFKGRLELELREEEMGLHARGFTRSGAWSLQHHGRLRDLQDPELRLYRLEAEWSQEEDALSAGRLWPWSPFALGMIDGAQGQLGDLSAYAGLEPGHLYGRPRPKRPLGGLSLRRELLWIGGRSELEGGLLISALSSSLHRLALGSSLLHSSGPFIAWAQMELDSQPELQLSRASLLSRYRWGRWDASLSLDHLLPELEPSLERESLRGDLSRWASWGQLRASLEVYSDHEGWALAPGVDGFIPLNQRFDLRGAWYHSQGQDNLIDLLNAGVGYHRLNLELDLGLRLSTLSYMDRELREWEAGLDAGLWWRWRELGIRLSGSITQAQIPHQRLFALLSWIYDG